MPKPLQPTWNITQLGNEAEIDIFDIIVDDDWMGGRSGTAFVEEVRAMGKVSQITVNVTSGGGQVWPAEMIYNTLVNHPARVVMNVIGIAASAASFVVMAGDERKMAANAMMMIHRGMIMSFGNSKELRESANLLDKIDETISGIYAQRTGRPVEEIIDMMDAETWMTAQEAKDFGFIDTITPNKTIAACCDLSIYNNVPKTAQQWVADAHEAASIFAEARKDRLLLNRRMMQGAT